MRVRPRISGGGRAWRGALCAALAGALMATAGCGRRARQTVRVRGGPLLGEPFAEMANAFTKAHPDVTVTADFSCPPCMTPTASPEKPRFDVLVSAGKLDMETFVARGVIAQADVRDFGTTDLVVILPPDSKVSVQSLADLTKDEIKRIDVGDPKIVATGIYAQQALHKAGLWDEVSPKLVECRTGCQALKAVALGEADAGFSYGFCLAGGKDTVQLGTVVDDELHQPVMLQIGLTRHSAKSKGAKAFVDYVLSEEGQDILRRHAIRAPVGSASAP